VTIGFHVKFVKIGFTPKCVNIGDEEHKVLQELDTCHWFCAPCNSKVSQVFPSIVKLSDRMKKFGNQISKTDREMQAVSERTAKVKEDLQKLSGELNNVRLELDNMKKLESPESWAEMAGKHVDAKLDSVALNVQNVKKALQEAREAALEEQDKESRRNNIIIYRSQESTAFGRRQVKRGCQINSAKIC